METMMTLSILFLSWMFVAIILFLGYLAYSKKLNTKIQSLMNENIQKTKELDQFHKKGKNPLGPWLEPSGKSYTLYLDKNGIITKTDDDFLKLVGYSTKELVGKNIYGTLKDKISDKEPLENNIVKKIFKNPKLYTEHETELKTKSGQKVWITWTNKIVFDKNNKPVELRSVGFDITKRKDLEAQLQFLASTDPQTGVLNKKSLLEIGTRELKRSIRYKHPFAVLTLKLLLKNDSELDRQTGDFILEQVITLCRHTIRDVDYLGRIDENEFCMLLPETPETQVIHLQKRIEQKIDTFNQENQNKINVIFGISAYTSEDKSLDNIIMRALKKSNKKGRK